ncbi:hypothetical protein Cs7R123_32010 [Catellatospora sp. TT07R-123]|uniref:hypothetical protein n=1 Tax=Catellatospora sp. TT07R-123 TaxID=2733863 RepID=UPI001B2426C5|nr:hypothetical protein [Catellatospora sp. TT07R-123]GHJ45859.1 hypothetical protein Cs7R123_32010 [Catellatospora sp. TT07R-123]
MRDTAINVLANLIAAAVIYLLGVAYGLFPSVRGAVIFSGGLIVVAGSGAVLTLVAMRADRETHLRGLFAWQLLQGVAGIAFLGGLIALVGAAVPGPTGGTTRSVLFVVVLLGVGIPSVIARIMAVYRRELQKKTAGEEEAKDLEGYPSPAPRQRPSTPRRAKKPSRK